MNNINKVTVAQLALRLGTEPAKLEAALLTDEKDETKMVDKTAEFLSPDIFIIPKSEFEKPKENTFLYNFQKTKYENGRTAGKEVALKDLKKAHGLETNEDIKDFDSLLKSVSDKAVAEAKLKPDEAVELLKTDKRALQAQVRALEAEKATLISGQGARAQEFAIKNQALLGVAKLNIDADDALVAGQRELVLDAFMSKHDFKDVDGVVVVVNKVSGKALQDAQLNNLSVEQAVTQFAPTYVKIVDGSAGGGRGASSSSNSSAIPTEVKAITNKVQFEAYLKSKDIKGNSDEAMAIYREVKKLNPKSVLV